MITPLCTTRRPPDTEQAGGIVRGRLPARCGAAAAVALLCGCSGMLRAPTERGAPPPDTQITAIQAVHIAQRAAREKNPGLMDPRSRAEFTGGRWAVSVNYTEPLDPLGVITTDGHCRVILDPSGKVLGCGPAGPRP